MRDKNMGTAADGRSVELLPKFSEVFERITVRSICPSLAPVTLVKQIADRPPTAQAHFLISTETAIMDDEGQVDWDDGSGDEEQTVFTFCKACNNAMRPQADSMTKVSLPRPAVPLSHSVFGTHSLFVSEPAIHLRLR